MIVYHGDLTTSHDPSIPKSGRVTNPNPPGLTHMLLEEASPPLSFSFMAEALMRMSASTSLSLYYVYNETSAGHAIW